MKRNIRNKVTLLCCGLAGACCLLGASLSIDMANVSAEETAVTMVAGAATRKDLENPGLKFTANITNYTESVNYGMLILPEQAFTKFTFNNDYVDVLDEAGKTYINKICTPYEVSEGQWQIACSIVDIYEDNYTRQFVGVAYALADGNYSYADVNMLDNARSVTYVAQMALQYETGLTEDETHALETFANPKCLLEETVEVDGIEDAGLTFGGEASLASANSALAVDGRAVGGNSKIPFVTKAAYSGITEITFDALIPEGYATDRVMLSFNSMADTYGSAYSAMMDSVGTGFEMIYNGVWTTYKLSISGASASFQYKPAGGEWATKKTFTSWVDKAYYMYVNICPSGNLNGNNDNAIIYFDNFSITTAAATVTDDFNISLENGLFKEATTTNALSLVSIGEKNVNLPAIPVKTTDVLAIKGKAIGGNEKVSAVTKESYAGITEISFDFYIPAAFGGERIWLGFTTAKGSYGYYNCKIDAGLKLHDKGSITNEESWYNATYTVVDGKISLVITAEDGSSMTVKSGVAYTEAAYYLYIGMNPGGGLNVDESVLFVDNFKVKTSAATVTDDFETSATAGLFEEGNTSGALSALEVVAPEFVEADCALAIKGNAIGGNEKVSAVTKNAYSGITEISFKAQMTDNFTKGDRRFWLAFTNTKGSYSYYSSGLKLHLKTTQGVWYEYTYSFGDGKVTLTAKDAEGTVTTIGTSDWTDGAYYIYVGLNPGGDINVADSVVLIDDFTVKTADGTYTDNFNASATGGLFEEGNTTGALSVVSVAEPKVDYDFDALLASGDINSVLYSGGYAYVQSDAVSLENLPTSSLAITGSFTYSITGDKAFALVLGGTESAMDYLYVSGNTLAFYNGVTLKKSVTLAATSNTITLAVTAGGRVCVKVGEGEFVAFGNVTAAPAAAFKAVALGGAGEVAITAINVSVYTCSAMPAYLSADEIEFTAYAPVTVKDWGSGAVNPI
ncbi:MAG: hypothetical protein IJB97_00120 [Clostridia bacterium]|nr:hypothetical protein [Clostridia bacterium]